MQLEVFQTCLTLGSVVLTAALGVYVHRLNGKYDERKRDDERRDAEQRELERIRKQEEIAQRNGIKAILRDRVIQADIHFSKEGEIELEEMENVRLMYEAYHQLGGNDIATASYRRVLNLPIAKREHAS